MSFRNHLKFHNLWMASLFRFMVWNEIRSGFYIFPKWLFL